MVTMEDELDVSTKWCHFEWPWDICNIYFKVTIFNVNSSRHGAR